MKKHNREQSLNGLLIKCVCSNNVIILHVLFSKELATVVTV